MIRMMVDLETWSVQPNAAIRSIGAVIFGDSLLHGKFERTFYCNVQRESLTPFPQFDIDPKTVLWWSQQSEEAQAAFADNPIAIAAAIKDFVAFYHSVDGIKEVWSRGSMDINALETACKVFMIEVPWKYSAVRDLRTESSRCEAWVEEREGFVKHHALHDAQFQTDILIEINKMRGID